LPVPGVIDDPGPADGDAGADDGDGLADEVVDVDVV
jgi:hypothetical protein